MSWTAWQILDSAFPVGGFAHSAGLEAAVQARAVRGEAELRAWLAALAWQAASSGLPFVSAAWRDPAALPAIDRACDQRLIGGAPHRASVLQGRSLADVAARTFVRPALAAIKTAIAGGAAGHHAPVFGAVTAGVELDLEDARRMWIFGAVRGAVSAAVRLGVVGPVAAQRLQVELGGESERAIAAWGDAGVDEAAWSSPVLEILAGAHERLRERLFVS